MGGRGQFYFIKIELYPLILIKEKVECSVYGNARYPHYLLFLHFIDWQDHFIGHEIFCSRQSKVIQYRYLYIQAIYLQTKSFFLKKFKIKFYINNRTIRERVSLQIFLTRGRYDLKLNNLYRWKILNSTIPWMPKSDQI